MDWHNDGIPCPYCGAAVSYDEASGGKDGAATFCTHCGRRITWSVTIFNGRRWLSPEQQQPQWKKA